MNIFPVSFGATDIIDFSSYMKKMPKADKSGLPEDTFEKSTDVDEQREEVTLVTQTEILNTYLTDLRKQTRTPVEIAKDMTKLLNSKETKSAFKFSYDSNRTEEIENFYDLTSSLMQRLGKSLSGQNTYIILDMALSPYDDMYEDFCIKCDDLYGDEEYPENIVYMLNSLIDTDNSDADEEETIEVIKNMAESIHKAFEENENPTFSLELTVDKKYNPEKCLNAFKNFLALVTLSKNSKSDNEESKK